MTDDEIIARCDANYHHSNAMLVGAMPGGENLECDGVVAMKSGLPVAWLNMALVVRPPRDAKAALSRAIEFFDGGRLPFIIRIREGLDEATERAAEALGAPYSDTVPGMAMRPPKRLPDPHPRLAIRAASNARELNEHVDILCESFHFPPDVAELMRVSDGLTRLNDVFLYVGYIDGEPVATSALMLTDRIAGVYNVATRDSHRKQGIGEAMTWHAVREGLARGAVAASLQASEMGQPIYERMGFRVVAPYRTFVRPEFRG